MLWISVAFLCCGFVRYCDSKHTFFNDTDWSDSLATKFPFPAVRSLDDCISACEKDDECVAVVYNPYMGQAECQLKCSAYESNRYTSINSTAVIVKPNAVTCPLAGWIPDSWKPGIDAGNLLVAGPKEPGGHIGNGYVASYMMTLPGSIGPTQSGVEYIAGVFAGSAYVKPKYPKWPNKWCISWCDRAHRMVIASWTTTARISKVNGLSIVETASAQDLQNHTYMLASKSVDSSVKCVQSSYAHRRLKHVVVTEFLCSNEGETAEIEVKEPGPSAIQTWDGKWVTPPMEETDVTEIDSGIDGVSCTQYRAHVAESSTTKATSVVECHVVCDRNKFLIKAGGQASHYCLSSRYSSVDYDAANQSLFELARNSLMEANRSRASLLQSHAAEMSRLLLPGIEVSGNAQLAKVINATWESFLQTFRADGIASPGSGGLGTDGYGGMGGSWDYELWHFPTLNLFHPPIARNFLQYRVDRIHAAQENARVMRNMYLPNRSFSGIAYPWMTAYSGDEQNPGMISGSSIEDHLQGDVAFGFLQYYQMTKDTRWLKDAGFPVIDGLARFWVSRVDKNADGSYSIRGTLPPDEYASPNSTDCVFTNAVARLNLLSAYRLSSVVGKTPDPIYLKIARGLRILYDRDVDYHPQCEGYVRGTRIKQSNAVMLGYPLRLNISKSTLSNDLQIYGSVMDPQGPAMSWSIHSIVARDLGEEERADVYLNKAYEEYVRGAFNIWHEGYGVFGGITNFITGSGGWLQTLWAGYGGLHINDDNLEIIRPRPPPNCSSIRFRRISYLGNSFDLVVTAEHGWTLQLVTSDAGASDLVVEAEGKVQSFGPHSISMLPTSSAKIYAAAASIII
eukprot:TRINITY_DN24932_c0_g2_i1.p1 TRINITY_DN24932_c0_g2~~TRINITY_DN24932_c0_g2_i1.p1  ORF type:complete len:863 (-),score=65.48 TRINITY_DN24932_c0_g2_i1:224-2773(-)